MRPLSATSTAALMKPEPSGSWCLRCAPGNHRSRSTWHAVAGFCVKWSSGSESRQVIKGGSLESTVLLNGDWVGGFEVTGAEGGNVVALDPIEGQYGTQIDDIKPGPGVPRPNAEPVLGAQRREARWTGRARPQAI